MIDILKDLVAGIIVVPVVIFIIGGAWYTIFRGK